MAQGGRAELMKERAASLKPTTFKNDGPMPDHRPCKEEDDSDPNRIVWKSKTRRPYRFCSRCWIKRKAWVLRSLTLPYGQCTNLNDHTNDTCPDWSKDESRAPT